MLDNLLNPADWEGTFSFQLQEYVNGGYQNLGAPVSISYSRGADNKTTVNLLKEKVYHQAGNYYYRIVEVVNEQNVANGIIYDTVYDRFYVSVVDDGTGKLKIDSVVGLEDVLVENKKITAEFNNEYNVQGAAQVVIGIDKIMKNAYGENANLLPSGFNFSLFEADSNYNITNDVAAVTSPTTGATGEVNIALRYEDLNQVGTHYYVLKENAGTDSRIDYSDKEYKVKIVVGQESGLYTVSAEIYDGNTLVGSGTAAGTAGNKVALVTIDNIEFENVFTPERITLRPGVAGTKRLYGRSITSEDNFRFAYYQTGADYNISNIEPIETVTAVNGSFQFAPNEYSREGTYYYVVKEVIPEGATDNFKDGITYDTSEYQIKVVVTGDATQGTLHAAATFMHNNVSTSVIEFHNRYTAEHTSAQITGTKALLGGIRKLQANAYSFVLIENGNVISTVRNGVPTDDYNAGFTFDLHYDTAGEHTCTVKELIPNGAVNNKYQGVTYDDTQFTVRVNVVDNGVGQLVASVDYNNTPVAFENEYTVAPTNFTLTAKKNLFGDDVANHTFKFALYKASYVNGELVQGDFIEEKTNDTEGNITFTGLNFAEIGGYHYIVKEVVENPVDLMVYDTAVYYVEIAVTDNLLGGLDATPKYTKVVNDESLVVNAVEFNNTYKEAPITAVIGGEKSFNKTLAGGEFTFELYQALPDVNGNINAVGEAALIATNNANGEFVFTEEADTGYITYSKEGTYYYVIKEQIPEDAVNNRFEGITYDDVIYTVTVEVTKSTDAGRSILVYDVEYSDTVVFDNNYTADKTSFAIGGHKDLKGRTLGTAEFTFVLYENGVEIDRKSNAQNGDFTFKTIEYTEVGEYVYTVKEDATDNKGGVTYDEDVYTVTVKVTDNLNGQLVKEVSYSVEDDDRGSLLFENTYAAEKISVAIGGKKTLNGRELSENEFTFVLYDKDGKEVGRKHNDKDGNFEFDEIEYTKVGEYVYTVKEDASAKAENITYDQSVFTVKVKVTDNREGKLVAEVIYSDGEEKADSISFENIYTEPVPDTGDNFSNTVWFVLSGMSALAILVLLGLKKKYCK